METSKPSHINMLSYNKTSKNSQKQKNTQNSFNRLSLDFIYNFSIYQNWTYIDFILLLFLRIIFHENRPTYPMYSSLAFLFGREERKAKIQFIFHYIWVSLFFKNLSCVLNERLSIDLSIPQAIILISRVFFFLHQQA